MNRRQVLASIATTSVIGAGFVSARQPTRAGSFESMDIDEIRIERNGDVVGTVSNPSTANIYQLLAARGDDEELYTSSDCCIEYCLEDCYGCECCAWGCSCSSGCSECC